MNTRQTDRLKTLLQTALPPTRNPDPERDPVPPRDLWPDLCRRIAAETPPSAHLPVAASVPWFDWALAGGVALVAVAFPAAVPLFFYYL